MLGVRCQVSHGRCHTLVLVCKNKYINIDIYIYIKKVVNVIGKGTDMGGTSQDVKRLNKKVGCLPSIHWVFLTIYKFLL